jgi:hypothetical protein
VGLSELEPWMTPKMARGDAGGAGPPATKRCWGYSEDVSGIPVQRLTEAVAAGVRQARRPHTKQRITEPLASSLTYSSHSKFVSRDPDRDRADPRGDARVRQHCDRPRKRHDRSGHENGSDRLRFPPLPASARPRPPLVRQAHWCPAEGTQPQPTASRGC